METFSISVTSLCQEDLSLQCLLFGVNALQYSLQQHDKWGHHLHWCKYRIIPLTSGGAWVDASVNESRMLFNTSFAGSSLALSKEN